MLTIRQSLVLVKQQIFLHPPRKMSNWGMFVIYFNCNIKLETVNCL